MTTLHASQKGLPAHEYAARVDAVLAGRAKGVLAADLASAKRPLHEQRWPTDAIADECDRDLAASPIPVSAPVPNHTRTLILCAVAIAVSLLFLWACCYTSLFL